MAHLERILEAAKAAPRRIALAEGEDPRVLEAALRASRDGIARPVLVGRAEPIRSALAAHGADVSRFAIEDPASSALTERYVEAYLEMRAKKGATRQLAETAIADPMGFAAMMVRNGDADGMIGGAVATTAHTVRTALQVIGKAPDARLVSSFFLMLSPADLPDDSPMPGAYVFADCGLVVDPDAGELADIAIASADSFRALTHQEPAIAMLSFSTKGSASHPRVEKVAEATRLAREARPDLAIDGELQFDAALIASVGASKAPGSTVAGRANVFAFPNLDAGNIGYKIAQRIGGATAIGPILQGLAKPANDLSRGCSVQDVYVMLAITSLQASG